MIRYIYFNNKILIVIRVYVSKVFMDIMFISFLRLNIIVMNFVLKKKVLKYFFLFDLNKFFFFIKF